jgi:hypothetical protein
MLQFNFVTTRILIKSIGTLYLQSIDYQRITNYVAQIYFLILEPFCTFEQITIM